MSRVQNIFDKYLRTLILSLCIMCIEHNNENITKLYLSTQKCFYFIYKKG